MAQNTNLNVTPYYDDFDKSKNFYRVLFRPGFPIQARELTSMQSVMQNQVENMGTHLFKDGAMVIPGQIGYDLEVDAIQVQESFLGADVENYRSQLTGKIITGLTSGVKAKVLYSISATTSEKGYITLYLKYIESGTESTGTTNTQQTFINNEQLVTDTEITFGTTLIEIGSPFAQLLPTAAIQTGSAAYVQTGVYFIRGFFVDVPYQYILLDQYGSTPKYRIGLEILESIITPEDDLSLNDNAAGTSNYAAPGSHRFRITTNLVKKLLTDEADKDFIELLRINGDKVEKLVDRSAYDELERSMATRTYEESGDYVVDDFQVTMRENLSDGFNNGVYESGDTTADGNSASEDKFAVEFGPGTAYVRGYRIKTLSPTYVDLAKPRDTNSAQNTIIPFELGNFSKVTNTYGFLNTSGSTITNAYQTLELRDNFTATPGDAQGNIIGYSRVASLEFLNNPDGTFGNADDQYKLHMFDVQMFTVIQMASAQTISTTASDNRGSLVVGKTSGARGYLVAPISSATHMQVYQIEGVFTKGEMITVDGLDKDTITNIHTYQYSDTRQVCSRDESTSSVEFTADIILEDILPLQGITFTYDATGSAEKITGLNSNFAADLRPGDRIYFNETKYVDVDYVTPTNLATANTTTIFNYSTQVVLVTPGAGGAAPSAGTYTMLLRYRGKLFDVDKATLLKEMPKPYVKSISDESMIVRRTFDNQTVSSSSLSITLPENEQFQAITDANYTFTVMGGTNGTYPIGDQLPVDTIGSGNIGYTTFADPSTKTTLNIANLTNITSVKVTASISKNVTAKKSKSPTNMFVMKVNQSQQDLVKMNYGLTYSGVYGTRIEDQELSLGLTDVFNIHAVYESLDDLDPIIPSVTLVEPAFFATKSIVTGATSKARARVVDFNSSTLKLTVVYLEGTFVSGETINGTNSSNVAIQGIINDSVGSVIAGSKVITDRYTLVNGQTDFLYGIAKLSREKGVAQPIRKLKIVLDYYAHAATGDYFGGQSYLDTDYTDIPFYDGLFLPDFLDFRPGVKNLYQGTGSVASPAYVQLPTLDFRSRIFPTSGTPSATLFDVPQINSDFRCDFDWYLSRVDKVFVLPTGEFQIIKGKSAENPTEPDNLQDGMLLAILKHDPYNFDVENDSIIIKSDNKRYTMRDIGNLETRLNSVEYYTSLNMLESDTFNSEILDASGKSRLKNGFIVDDFTDHSKSNMEEEDYSASLDYSSGTAHVSHYTTNISLQLDTSLSQNYQQTGPLITLPYVEEALITQPYASRVENVNPFNVFAYIGRIDLTPASDDWVDTNRLPRRVTNIEGNFRATRRRLNVDQNGFAPTQWRAWRTTWTGDTDSGWSRFRERTFANFVPGRGRRVLGTRTTTTNRRQTRSGIRTRVVPRIDRRSLGDRIVSQTSIPWIRSRNIEVVVARMKPRTKFFSFFDGQKVDDYMIPKVIELIKNSSTDSRTNSTPFVVGELVRGLTSRCRFQVAAPNDFFKYNQYDDTEMPTSYASTTAFLNIDTNSLARRAIGRYYGNFQVGEVLLGQSGARAVVKERRAITDRLGQWKGAFFIPSPRNRNNPRWSTGDRTLRLTTSKTDSRLPGSVASSAETEYSAKGTLRRVQENVLAIRNARLVRDTRTQRRNRRSTRTETRQVGWWDPLAQSFLITEDGGTFITSVDVYFNTKDTNIPISMQIRTMENGYPTTTILPFSDTTITPDDVQISETGAIATRFTFRSPVYIPQSIEHCFVLFSDSNSYQVWISRMGELDISGDRTISEQPYAGVLFKSQNATTWTADQYEDLKFVVNRARFTTNTNSRVTFTNAPLDVGNNGKITLGIDPIQTYQPELQLNTASSNLTDTPFTIGARVYQKQSLAQGTITAKANKGGGGFTLTINDISGTWVDAQAIVSSKTLGTITVTSTSGYAVGDTITGGTSSTTSTIVTVTNATTLAVNYLSGAYTNGETITGDGAGGGTASQTTTIPGSGTNTVPSGDRVSSATVQAATQSGAPTYDTSNKKIRIAHSDHGMHDLDNNVIIEGAISEVSPTYLTSAISASDTAVNVNDATAFHKIINGAAITASNVGYIKIEDEIMSYSAISNDNKTITVHERGLDGTTAVTHADETVVECYNLDGIPLIEINKTHVAIAAPALDGYDIATSSLGRLGIRSGGDAIVATQNVQYEILVPQIERMLLPKTDITARVNTITGTSINDGTTMSQNSFSNTGEFYDVNLSEDNPFNAPQLICSEQNESAELNGAKSFRMDLTLTSGLATVSPVIDTDRLSITTVSQRINNPTNADVAKRAVGDEHAAVYISKAATLTNNSSSIKLMFAGYRPPNTFIKPLYRVLPAGSSDPIESYGFEFFPTEGAKIPATTDLELYYDYEYEVTGLDFTQYQVKLVFVSANQAFAPTVKELRAIALAV